MESLTEIQGRSVTLAVADRPLVMGIVNVTPDSFSDGGLFYSENDALRHALSLIEQGADLLDIGGESTRPGAESVSVEEELRRTIPLIKHLIAESPVPISIDTSKAAVAQAALECGAQIVNDVTALQGDPEMASVISQSGAGVVLMHMQGTPQTMQRDPQYSAIVPEIAATLKQRAHFAESQGIAREKIILDPGIGFGKTVAHNLMLLKNVAEFKALGYPILLGASRKSFIGCVLETEVDNRLAGSLAAAAWAFQEGVQILRVHDVQSTCDLLNMLRAIKNSE